MADDYVEVEMKGLDELQSALEALPVKYAKKVIRTALKEGAKPIEGGMVNGAPKETGFLSEHFGTRISIRRDELAGSAYIGPQGKIDYPYYASGAYKIKRNKKGKARKVGRIAVATVARFLEFGTSKLAKFPFMTQAFEAYKNTALERITKVLHEKLDEAVSESKTSGGNP